MNKNIDDGGQAFPAPPCNEGPSGDLYEPLLGMSLRDYFAAAALTGYRAHPAHDQVGYLQTSVAAYCYSVADAMLAAREVKS